VKGLGSFLPLVILAVLFYALVLRPSKRRQQQAARTADSLQPGVEIITTAGMLATVHAVEDKHVLLEIAPGVVVRYVKGAVARVVPPDEPDEPDTFEAGADSSAAGDEPTNTSQA
jgi:preprotein translocase subunit YajC